MRQGIPKRVEILDDVIANQIAAGEVVERPYHAIKELIENAIDAYANHISIFIEEGGFKSIKIIDDGHGMEEADACNAIQKHGTSKIKKIEDLNTIATLGFRGEALPSIAAISRFSLKTRTSQQNHAIKISLEGGKNLDKQYASGNVGTEIEVRDLYFNVPARRSFQKSAKVESEAIRELVLQQMLCYPEIAFKLVIDDREVFHSPIQNQLKNRISYLFGPKIFNELQSIDYHGEFQLKGFISNQNCLYSAHKHAYTYVNDRLVKPTFFWNMIETAFKSKLPKGRYPFYILKLQISPYLVDVNIHPNKTEVRFANENKIREVLLHLFSDLARHLPDVVSDTMSLPSIDLQPDFQTFVNDQNHSFSTSAQYIPVKLGAEPNEKNESQKTDHFSHRSLFIPPHTQTHSKPQQTAAPPPTSVYQPPRIIPTQPSVKNPIEQKDLFSNSSAQHFTQHVSQPQVTQTQPSFTQSPFTQSPFTLPQSNQNQTDWKLNDFGQSDQLKPLAKVNGLRLSLKNISLYKQIGILHERWWQLEGEDGFALIDLGMIKSLLCLERIKYKPLETPIVLNLPKALLDKLHVRQGVLHGLGIDIQKRNHEYFIEQSSHPYYDPALLPSLIQSYLQIDQLLQAKEKLRLMIAEFALTPQQRVELIKQIPVIDEIFAQNLSLRNSYKITSIFKYSDLIKS
jgi:DNA mismatch repair protein MutL